MKLFRLEYRSVWRWHFYAGLFSIPLILWLSITGSIYLFRPQIERWLDRPYDYLPVSGPLQTPEAIVHSALAAVPGSHLHFYELPPGPHSAVRVIVGRGADEFRVYVHPQTGSVLKVINEDRRPMMILFHLHGELLQGNRGSYVVELAASWAVILILTGLFLWWPRQTERLAGIAYIRLRQGRRLFWRDLHAVTGVWISALALLLILTGLPWAAFWGSYLQHVRSFASSHRVHQDWTIGSDSERDARLLRDANSMPGMNMGGSQTGSPEDALLAGAPLSRLVSVAGNLSLAPPVRIAPPENGNTSWTVSSDSPNRTQQTTVHIDPAALQVVKTEPFRQRPLLDRWVDVGTTAHEGQLFGVANQLLGLFTAAGLVLLCLSATVLWWRRRESGVLGAPLPSKNVRLSPSLLLPIIALVVYLPMFGASLLAVLCAERYALSRVPPCSAGSG